MAKQTITKVTCDLDPEVEAAGTVRLAVGDTAVELDLSADRLEEFNEDMKPYLEAGRPLTARASNRPRGRSNGSNGGAAKSQAPLIRAWAKEQGLSVPNRGRIPAPIVDQYAATVGVGV